MKFSLKHIIKIDGDRNMFSRKDFESLVEMVKKKTEGWNSVIIDFTETKIKNLDLSYLDLSHFDFSKSRLKNIDLTHSTLNNVSFENSFLQSCAFDKRI